jgi:hypothetical protein
LERISDLIDRHEVPVILSLFLGAAGAWTSWSKGLSVLAILAILAIGAAGGALLVAAAGRRKFPLRCIKCIKRHELRGERGREALNEEHLQFLVRKDLDSFPLSVRFTDGKVLAESIRYRNLGKNGKKQQQGFRDLDDEHIVFSPIGPDGQPIRILLPAPAVKGDIIELQREYRSEDAFPGDPEAVGKRVIFPIDSLEFLVHFEGCQIRNCRASRLYGPVAKPGGYEPLEPTVAGSSTEVYWKAGRAVPGERFEVGWRWASDLQTNASKGEAKI